MSLGLWCHTHSIGPTRHKRTHPALTPTSEGWWYSIYLYPGGMEGWVDLGGWLHYYTPRWFTRPQTVTHPSINRARRRVMCLVLVNDYTHGHIFWLCLCMQFLFFIQCYTLASILHILVVPLPGGPWGPWGPAVPGVPGGPVAPVSP